MSISHVSLFGLNNDYSWNDLELAYNAKVAQINGNSGLNDLDRRLYLDQLNRYYRDAKNELTHRERDYPGSYNVYPQMGLRNWMWDGVDFFDRMERRLNNRIDSLYNSLRLRGSSSSSSETTTYSSNRQHLERRMSDGSLVVVESYSRNENGNDVRSNDSWVVLPNGERRNLDYNETLAIINEKSTNQMLEN
jgi:hypothetical protein